MNYKPFVLLLICCFTTYAVKTRSMERAKELQDLIAATSTGDYPRASKILISVVPAPYHVTGTHNRTLLHLAALCTFSANQLKFMEAMAGLAPSTINALDALGHSPLYYCVEHANRQAFELLSRFGAEADTKGPNTLSAKELLRHHYDTQGMPLARAHALKRMLEFLISDRQ